MNALTFSDRRGFRFIVDNAHREGWIPADASLDAEYLDASVRITATRGNSILRKTYARDARWHFQLLHDLAWGVYRNESSP